VQAENYRTVARSGVHERVLFDLISPAKRNIVVDIDDGSYREGMTTLGTMLRRHGCHARTLTFSLPTILSILSAILFTPAEALSAETVNYSYDVFGRLKTVRISGGPANGVERAVKYDASDNRVGLLVSGSWSSDTVTVTPLGGVANTTSAGVVLGVNINGPAFFGGTVTFAENGTFLGSAPIQNGQASLLLEGFSLGSHTITATYSGDGDNPSQVFTFTIKVQNLSWLPAVLEIILSD
jgi:hypothetical protein